MTTVSVNLTYCKSCKYENGFDLIMVVGKKSLIFSSED